MSADRRPAARLKAWLESPQDLKGTQGLRRCTDEGMGD
jgi:hypothetical protein